MKTVEVRDLARVLSVPHQPPPAAAVEVSQAAEAGLDMMEIHQTFSLEATDNLAWAPGEILQDQQSRLLGTLGWTKHWQAGQDDGRQGSLPAPREFIRESEVTFWNQLREF